MRGLLALLAAVGLVAVLASSSSAAPPPSAAAINDFSGSFDLVGSGTSDVVGHVVASFREPMPEDLVPGHVDITWTAGDPWSGSNAHESHAQVLQAFFWADSYAGVGATTMGRVVGILCDYVAPQSAVCHEFAMVFQHRLDPSLPNAVGFSKLGSTKCCDGPWFEVGKGSFALTYVAPSPAQTPVPASPRVTAWKTYVVVPGDTLSGIAQHHSVGLDAILAANSQITNPNLIHVGDQIAIPPRVTLHGSFFAKAPANSSYPSCRGLSVPPETVTDGRFQQMAQLWCQGAVWWEDPSFWQGKPANAAGAQWIEISLDGTYTIDSAIVQADDNDTHLLSYRDPRSGAWVPLWAVPVSSGGGLHTRPNPLDNAERHVFASPVTTDALRFQAASGDGMYSVSEIEAFGTPSVVGVLPRGTHDGSTELVATSAASCYANGWAQDADHPSQDVRVRILADGTSVWAGYAGTFRPDLLAAGIGDGTAAFWVNLAGRIGSHVAHEIRVQAQDLDTGAWVDLYSTPRALTCN